MSTDKTVIFPLSDAEQIKRNAELAELVRKAKVALREAEAFADKYHLTFNWSPAYGMGGYYCGSPDSEDKDDYYGREHGWHSSSEGC